MMADQIGDFCYKFSPQIIVLIAMATKTDASWRTAR